MWKLRGGKKVLSLQKSDGTISLVKDYISRYVGAKTYCTNISWFFFGGLHEEIHIEKKNSKKTVVQISFAWKVILHPTQIFSPFHEEIFRWGP